MCEENANLNLSALGKVVLFWRSTEIFSHLTLESRVMYQLCAIALKQDLHHHPVEWYLSVTQYTQAGLGHCPPTGLSATNNIRKQHHKPMSFICVLMQKDLLTEQLFRSRTELPACNDFYNLLQKARSWLR